MESIKKFKSNNPILHKYVYLFGKLLIAGLIIKKIGSIAFKKLVEVVSDRLFDDAIENIGEFYNIDEDQLESKKTEIKKYIENIKEIDEKHNFNIRIILIAGKQQINSSEINKNMDIFYKFINSYFNRVNPYDAAISFMLQYITGLISLGPMYEKYLKEATNAVNRALKERKVKIRSEFTGDVDMEFGTVPEYDVLKNIKLDKIFMYFTDKERGEEYDDETESEIKTDEIKKILPKIENKKIHKFLENYYYNSSGLFTNEMIEEFNEQMKKIDDKILPLAAYILLRKRKITPVTSSFKVELMKINQNNMELSHDKVPLLLSEPLDGDNILNEIYEKIFNHKNQETVKPGFDEVDGGYFYPEFFIYIIIVIIILILFIIMFCSQQTIKNTR